MTTLCILSFLWFKFFRTSAQSTETAPGAEEN
jgi:hypothetical protein